MKSKKKGMDVSNIHSSRCRHLTPPFQYNADIPFEKKAAPGFYDTSEEQARASIAPVGQSLRRLENKRKPGEEEEAEQVGMVSDHDLHTITRCNLFSRNKKRKAKDAMGKASKVGQSPLYMPRHLSKCVDSARKS